MNAYSISFIVIQIGLIYNKDIQWTVFLLNSRTIGSGNKIRVTIFCGRTCCDKKEIRTKFFNIKTLH